MLYMHGMDTFLHKIVVVGLQTLNTTLMERK